MQFFIIPDIEALCQFACVRWNRLASAIARGYPIAMAPYP